MKRFWILFPWTSWLESNADKYCCSFTYSIFYLTAVTLTWSCLSNTQDKWVVVVCFGFNDIQRSFSFSSWAPSALTTSLWGEPRRPQDICFANYNPARLHFLFLTDTSGFLHTGLFTLICVFVCLWTNPVCMVYLLRMQS